MDDATTVTVVVGLVSVGFAWVMAPIWIKSGIVAMVLSTIIRVLRGMTWVATVGRRGVSPVSLLLSPQAVAHAAHHLPDQVQRLLISPSQLQEEYDVVVVGGGPAGLAAVRELAFGSSGNGAVRSVLLVDEGGAFTGGASSGALTGGLPNEMSVLRIPAAAAQASHVKHGRVKTIPARLTGRTKSALTAHQTESTAAEVLKGGLGVDGSSATDDGSVRIIHEDEWLSLFNGDEARAARAMGVQRRLFESGSAVVPTFPSVFRCPTAWIFQHTVADSTGEEAPANADDADDEDSNDIEKEWASLASLWKPKWTSFRSRFRPSAGMAKDRLGDALLAPLAVPDGHGGKVCAIHVLPNATCLPLNSESRDTLCTSTVVLRLGGDSAVRSNALREVRVQRFVMLAAGALRTPSLLPGSIPSVHRTPAQDGITFPLIYQCNPGFSQDVAKTQSLLSLLRHAALAPNYAPDVAFAANLPEAERRPPSDLTLVASVLSDGCVELCIPSPSHSSSIFRVTVELIAAGGFNRELFEAQRISKVLGVFKEAVLFRVTILPPPTLVVHNETDADGESGRNDLDGAKPAVEVRNIDDVIAVAGSALKWCRLAAQRSPLSAVLTGREAMDLKLMGGDVPPDAFRLLYGKVKKAGGAQRERLQQRASHVFSWIREHAESAEYIERYVRTHARLAGVPCATLTISPGSDGLNGNIFIADSSLLKASPSSALVASVVQGTLAVQDVLKHARQT